MTPREIVYAAQDLAAWSGALDVPAASMPGSTPAERERRARDLELAATATVEQAARIALGTHPTDPARAERIVTAAREVVAAPEWDDVLNGQRIDDDERARLYRRIHGLLSIMGDPLAVADVPPIARREDGPQPIARPTRAARPTVQPTEEEPRERASSGAGVGIVLAVLVLGGLALANRARA